MSYYVVRLLLHVNSIPGFTALGCSAVSPIGLLATGVFENTRTNIAIPYFLFLYS